jgi:hypothetical protein
MALDILEIGAEMVKVTIDVPEPLLGDIYIVVGAVLDRDQRDRDLGDQQEGTAPQNDGQEASEEA